MSTIVCVQTSRNAVAACDTLRYDGTHLQPGEMVRPSTKVIRLGSALVGCAGYQVYENVLEHWAKGAPKLDDRRSIFDFFVRFLGDLRMKYHFAGEREHNGSPFLFLDARFIILNKKGIFTVDGDLAVTQYERYWAIGSGGVFALGALDALYDENGDSEAIARRAVDAGMKFDPYSGGTTEVCTLVTSRRRRQ